MSHGKAKPLKFSPRKLYFAASPQSPAARLLAAEGLAGSSTAARTPRSRSALQRKEVNSSKQNLNGLNSLRSNLKEVQVKEPRWPSWQAQPAPGRGRRRGTAECQHGAHTSARAQKHTVLDHLKRISSYTVLRTETHLAEVI